MFVGMAAKAWTKNAFEEPGLKQDACFSNKNVISEQGFSMIHHLHDITDLLKLAFLFLQGSDSFREPHLQ